MAVDDAGEPDGGAYFGVAADGALQGARAGEVALGDAMPPARVEPLDALGLGRRDGDGVGGSRRLFGGGRAERNVNKS